MIADTLAIEAESAQTAGALGFLARAMVRYPKRLVRNVTVITTSGGGGAISADQLSRAGIELTRFNAATQAGLAEHYAEGQGANPIDIGGRKDDATDELGVVTVELALSDPQTDLALMVLTTAPDVPGLTRQLADGADKPAAEGKPTLFVMLPGRLAVSARAMLVERSLPYVDTLAEAMSVLAAWKCWSNYQEPDEPVRPTTNYSFVRPVAGALGEAMSKALVGDAGLPVNREHLVRDTD